MSIKVIKRRPRRRLPCGWYGPVIEQIVRYYASRQEYEGCVGQDEIARKQRADMLAGGWTTFSIFTSDDGGKSAKQSPCCACCQGALADSVFIQHSGFRYIEGGRRLERFRLERELLVCHRCWVDLTEIWERDEARWIADRIEPGAHHKFDERST